MTLARRILRAALAPALILLDLDLATTVLCAPTA